ncbi:hypothetical protein ACIOKD_01115 [Streptomyces sp. NPDC087844]
MESWFACGSSVGTLSDYRFIRPVDAAVIGTDETLQPEMPELLP